MARKRHPFPVANNDNISPLVSTIPKYSRQLRATGEQQGQVLNPTLVSASWTAFPHPWTGPAVTSVTAGPFPNLYANNCALPKDELEVFLAPSFAYGATL